MNTTDPDILAVLTPEQLKRRRQLRRRYAAVLRKERRKISRQQNPSGRATGLGHCAGETENGEKCLSKPVIGSIFCQWHMQEAERERLGIRDPREVTKRRAGMKAPELMRQIMEQETLSILAPYFEGLGIKLEGYDEETGKPVITYDPDGGLRLFGESKDGDIEMSPYRDIGGMVAIAEKLLDRVYGKPKQSTTIEGGVSPIRVQPVKSEDRAIEVAQILAQARALPPAPSQTPHEGRRRSAPASDTVIDIDDHRHDEDA